MAKMLRGLRVAVLIADGFEQVEVTKPVKALEREGAIVEFISLRRGKIMGMNFVLPGKRIRADLTIQKANPSDYDALFIPGGFVNPDLLRQSEAVRAFVRAFDAEGKPIASICHGPEVLISAGLVGARRMTSWPGIKDDVENAGGHWVDEAVVEDGAMVSSRGPQDLPAFDAAMIRLFEQRVPAIGRRPPQKHRVRKLVAAGAMLGFGEAVRRAYVAA